MPALLTKPVSLPNRRYLKLPMKFNVFRDFVFLGALMRLKGVRILRFKIRPLVLNQETLTFRARLDDET